MMIAMSCFLSVVGTVMSMRLAFKMETLDYPNEIKIDPYFSYSNLWGVGHIVRKSHYKLIDFALKGICVC